MKVDPKILKAGDVLLAHNDKRKHTAIYYAEGKVVHASLNEKGGTKNGKPGDQTGREICTAGVSGEWDFILRYPDERIGQQAALLAKAIADDDSHGYDQVNRQGNPDYDCSSLVFHVYNELGIPVKKYGSWTGDLRAAFTRCGFKEVTNMTYCNVELPEIKPGDKGQAVKTMQTLLQMRGYDTGLPDGDYGPKTQKAVDSFHRANHLTPYDHICGRGTWTKLIL